MTENIKTVKEKLNTFSARVKLAFSKDEHGQIQPEVAHIPMVVLCGSFVGMMLGGRHGIRIRGATTIANNQLTVYTSSAEAKREYFSAILLGFFQYGCRWGWRTGLYAGIYSSTLTAMSVGRDREDAINYITAGAVTGTVYKIFSGIRGIIIGMVLGAGICTPVGLCMQGIGYLVPYERVLKEKREEERARRNEQLQTTEKILEGMSKELEDSKTM